MANNQTSSELIKSLQTQVSLITDEFIAKVNVVNARIQEIIREHQQRRETDEHGGDDGGYRAEYAQGSSSDNVLSSGEMPNDALPRKLALLKKEIELMLRESEVLRREEALPNSDSDLPAGTESVIRKALFTSVVINLHDISELVPVYYGPECEIAFSTWKEDIEFARNVYQLDEAATRMLIHSRLKYPASTMFRSELESRTSNIKELFEAMEERLSIE